MRCKQVLLTVTCTCVAANHIHEDKYLPKGWAAGLLAVSYVGLGLNTSLAAAAWLVVNRIYRASAKQAWHRLQRWPFTCSLLGLPS